MQEKVRAKKHLGQHFLNDENIARKIVDALPASPLYNQALEIGPGMGVLTKYLLERNDLTTHVIDIDTESVAYLETNFPPLKGRIISGDFLKLDLSQLFSQPFAVIGNFPYNISSQILFKVLDHRNQVPVVVGMFQKEVGERVAAVPRNKTYGIISVLLQAFYNIEYLFTVSETVFTPPPKVKSGVIRLTRNNVQQLNCSELLFIKVVKTGFNQRRKTLRNALSSLLPQGFASAYLSQRAEELSVNDFVLLTASIENHQLPS